MRSHRLTIIVLTIALLGAAVTAHAASMLITVSPDGSNWQYDFQVTYNGEMLGSVGFGALEVEIPDWKIIPQVGS